MNIWPSQPSASAATTASMVVECPPARQNSTTARLRHPSLAASAAASAIPTRNSRAEGAKASTHPWPGAFEQVRARAFRQGFGFRGELGLGDDGGVAGDGSVE